MKEEKRKELGKKLQDLVHKSTGQNEAVFADGGALVNQGIYPDILSPNFAEGSLYADCTIINVGDNKNGLKIPVTSETNRSKTTVKGGYRAYVVGEGATKSNCSGKFLTLDLTLNKEAVVIWATDEILQDSEALASYMNKSAEEAIMALTDDSIIHGNGLMHSIAGHPSTGFSALTDPLTLAELHDFYDLYYGGKAGKWYMTKVRFTQILDLFEPVVTAGTGGGSLILTVTAGVYYLFGLPIVIADTMLDNEILLADLTQYVIIQKPMTSAVNQSIRWLEDEQGFRFVLRINGDGLWKAGPITLADGSIVHPFVMAAGFEESSSSEQSSMSESSSSESSIITNSSMSSASSEKRDHSSSSSLSTPSSDSESTPSSKSNSSQSLSTASSQSQSSDSESTPSSRSQSSDSESTPSSMSLSSVSDSSESTGTSGSSMSLSSQSTESESLSSESEGNVSTSSSSHEGCGGGYLAADFATALANGIYNYAGVYATKASYYNGTYYLWIDSVSGYWAMSGTRGDPQNQWISSIDTIAACPDGDSWVSENGTITLAYN